MTPTACCAPISAGWLVSIFVLILSPAAACDCSSGVNACEAAARHSAVFVGTVLSSEPGTAANVFATIYRIRVDERIIGDLPAEVHVGDGRYRMGCGSGLAGRGPMILYANGSPSGILRTSMCGTRNIPATSALPDLEQLRALRTFREKGIAGDPCAPPAPPPGRASIEGRILDAAGQPARAAIILSLRHPGESKPIYKAALAAGVFRFNGVAAGRYVLHLDRTFYRTPYRPAYFPGVPANRPPRSSKFPRPRSSNFPIGVSRRRRARSPSAARSRCRAVPHRSTPCSCKVSIMDM